MEEVVGLEEHFRWLVIFHCLYVISSAAWNVVRRNCVAILALTLDVWSLLAGGLMYSSFLRWLFGC